MKPLFTILLCIMLSGVCFAGEDLSDVLSEMTSTGYLFTNDYGEDIKLSVGGITIASINSSRFDISATIKYKGLTQADAEDVQRILMSSHHAAYMVEIITEKEDIIELYSPSRKPAWEDYIFPYQSK